MKPRSLLFCLFIYAVFAAGQNVYADPITAGSSSTFYFTSNLIPRGTAVANIALSADGQTLTYQFTNTSAPNTQAGLWYLGMYLRTSCNCGPFDQFGGNRWQSVIRLSDGRSIQSLTDTYNLADNWWSNDVFYADLYHLLPTYPVTDPRAGVLFSGQGGTLTITWTGLSFTYIDISPTLGFVGPGYVTQIVPGQQVPEPGTLALVGTGLALAARSVRRRRRAKAGRDAAA